MAVTIYPNNATRVSVSSKPGPKKKGAADDKSTWLIRADASDLLGCSLQTLLNKEREGKLHPVRVTRLIRDAERQVFVYDPKELAQLPRRNRIDNPGERSARAFELLDEGMTDREIVIELRETPDWVRDHRASWLEGGGSDVVITPDARIELAKLVGSFTGVADLVGAIKRLVAAHPPRELTPAKDD